MKKTRTAGIFALLIIALLVADGLGAAAGKGHTSLAARARGLFTGLVPTSSASAAGPAAPVPVQASCVAPPPGMVAWYPGDGNADDIQNGNHGTPQGNATFAPGMVGQTIRLDGNGDRVSVGNPASLRLQDFTIDAWIKRGSSTVVTNDGRPGVEAGTFFAYGNGGYGFGIEQATNRLLLTRVEVSAAYSTGTITDTNYHHVAVTKSGGSVTFYIDGVASGSASYNPTFTFTTDAAIGARGDGDLQNAFFGDVDELEIFNRALSPTEIQTIATAGGAGKCKPQCTTPPSGMALWLAGDGTATDGSGNNHHGTPQNGATFAAGKVAQAFSFDGVNDRVEVPDAPALNPTTAVTLDAWVNPQSLQKSTNAVVAKSSESAGQRSYGMWITNDGRVHVEPSSLGTSIAVTPPGVVPLNTWTHVAAVITAGVGFKIYVNGAEQSVATTGPLPALSATSVPVTVGNSDVGVRDWLFKGLIDEVEIFNRALSPTEIQAIAAAGSAGKCRTCTAPPSGMVAWLGGDGTASDLSGNNNHGTPQNGATFAAGKVAQAFNLDGTDDFVSAPDSASLNFGAGEFAIDAWVSFNSTAGEQVIVEKFIETMNSNAAGYVLTKMPDNRIRLGFTGGGFVESAPQTLAAGNWYHVAATRGAGGAVAVYLDGTQIATGGNTSNVNSTSSLKIGHRGSPSDTPGSNDTRGFYLNGRVDEVELFNRALSQAEIQAIVNAGSAGKCKGGVTPTPTPTATPTPTPTPSPTPTPEVLHQIGGRVTDAGGSGVPGVFMYLSGSDGSSQAVYTRPDGSYAFTGLPAGVTYTLTPDSPGLTFNPPSRTFESLSADQTADFTDVSTTPTPSPSPTPQPTPCPDPSVGCLDATFDVDGKVLGGGGLARAAALQPDGKVVVAGDSGLHAATAQEDFVLRRYNADGSPDTDFGAGGTVTTDFFNQQDTATAVLIQPDGKIVAVGSAGTSGTTDRKFALARYNPNGSPDAAFGAGGADGDGKVTSDFGRANAAALQSDGKIVAAGSSFTLARYNADGTPDTGFGTGGRVTTDFSNRTADANAVVIQADGKLVAAGSSRSKTDALDSDFALARYNADGSLDSSFDNDGRLVTNFGGRDEAFDVALQPDGLIVAAGTVTWGGFTAGDIALARYNQNGSPDASFDGDGKLSTDFSGFDSANAVALRPDGKLVVAGTLALCSGADFSLTRYNTNGSLDTGFGVNGRQTVDFAGRVDTATSLLVQPDGRLVAAGYSVEKGEYKFALARNIEGAGCAAQTPTPTPTPGATPSPSPTPPPTGEIAFVSFRAPGQGVFVMNADGSSQTRRTTGDDTEPSFSPDGRRIVFRSMRDGVRGEIWVMNSDGTGQTRLTNNPSFDRTPTFSPDGQRIAFTSERDTNSEEIYVMNADGSNVVRLTNSNGNDFQPSFSPDGMRIAFVSQRTGNNEIWLMNSDGTNPVQLTNTAANINDVNPSFSPDGTRIAFERYPNVDPIGNAEIYVMNADGTGVTRLTDNSQIYDAHPSFSPDGTRIAFTSSRDGGTQIHVMNADGSNPTRLTDSNPGSNFDPSWGGGGRLPASTFQFSAATYQAAEGKADLLASSLGSGELHSSQAAHGAAAAGQGVALLEITRSGDLSQPAEVEYATQSGTATDRTDFTAAYGTLHFSAGESSKTLVVLITDDLYHEEPESFSVALSNPVGAGLGAQASAAVNVTSDDAATGQSPVRRETFDSDHFVRYHYADFLNRLPDAPGLAFWKGDIDRCGPDLQCREVKMINVSAAFFLSIEFQQTGFLVYRMHQAAFDTGERLQLPRFLADTQEIRQGVVVGQGQWEQQLEANKQAFAERLVAREPFLARHPAATEPSAFVDALNANTGGSLTPAERDALVGQLAAAGNTTQERARVLRAVSESPEFTRRQFNKAFVLMQYYGYLRRNPPDPPDLTLDYQGYNYWLRKLEDFQGSYINAEMVKAFIDSIEYKARFGQ